MTTSFDRVADLYRRQFADELDRKPFDRRLLDRVARRFPTGAPVLEVGSGPAQVGAYLRARGVPVIASDASVGQLREALALDPTRPVLAADLGGLPARAGAFAGIVAFYCLIYGPAEHLGGVFAEWHRALRPGGVAVIAVHAGEGTIHFEEWFGRTVDVTIVLRDPDALVAQLESNGFAVDERTVRPPYDDEHQTDRCYVVATRAESTS